MLTGQYNYYYLQSFPRVSTVQNLFTTSDMSAAIYEVICTEYILQNTVFPPIPLSFAVECARREKKSTVVLFIDLSLKTSGQRLSKKTIKNKDGCLHLHGGVHDGCLCFFCFSKANYINSKRMSCT